MGSIISKKRSKMSDSTNAVILTEETVPEYLSKHSDKIGVFGSNAKVTAKSILGGNVNYAFRAVDEEDETKSVFVKQAPEFVAIFGPDGLPLTSDRMNQEIAVYNQWREILGSDTKYLPKIYHFDSK
jgi:5-methylthioribose kinase